MSVFKCKMCGGELKLTKGSNLAVCQNCGTQQTVPAIDDDKKARLFNRANNYRMECEFDKAYSAYESIVNEDPTEAEAYWGLVLSEYGVEYVDDPKTEKKIPTCHRTLMHSITTNENYKLACQNADSERRVFYEDEAETLDALQKRVLNASAKEEPYDVFICYKETNEQGERTKDSVMAQEIYDALTAKKLRVFFSRITLEDRLGEDYEPCIFAALNSAKVMLMVTTDSASCNSVWVKNEWKRYLDFMKNDSSKKLIPVYKDMSPYALPDEFSKFQAQDMGKIGAMQDLIRGVEKLLGKTQNSKGMTQEEKTMVDAMLKGQKRIKAVLFSVFFCVAVTFLLPMTVYGGKGDYFRVIAYKADWELRFEYFEVYIIGAYYLCGISAGITVTYGFRSKVAQLLFLILYFVFAVSTLLILVPKGYYHLGILITMLFVYSGLGALITTLAVNEKKSIKRIILLAIIIISALLIWRFYL